MKKYLIALLIILSACAGLKKSGSIASKDQINRYVKLKKFHNDTLGYVQHNFIVNKKKYIGKELHTLLKDVEIPIKSYIEVHSVENNNIIKGLFLQFYSEPHELDLDYYGKKPVDIIIRFIQPLPTDSTIILLKKTKGEWTKDAEIYFGRQKIGNIATTKYEN